MTAPLRVALGEYDTGWHEPAASLGRAADVVARSASAGADLVVLPEMCTTGFTMESTRFAEPVTGPSAAQLAEIARLNQVHLLAGVATRASEFGTESFYNSALLFSPEGELLVEYRKQRLFGYAGEREAYAAGSNPVVVEISGVRLGLFICFDLRFPELFRAVAADVDAMVLLANWPAVRRPHWDALIHARAIENQCYFVAVNRIGEGGGLAYNGGSVVRGPWGEQVAASATGAEIACADLDPTEVARIRAAYPFLEASMLHSSSLV